MKASLNYYATTFGALWKHGSNVEYFITNNIKPPILPAPFTRIMNFLYTREAVAT